LLLLGLTFESHPALAGARRLEITAKLWIFQYVEAFTEDFAVFA
jgi:hypothetical protein